MQSTAPRDVMITVHSLLRDAFGRQVVELAEDGLVQPLRFPGGSYMLVVRPASQTAVTVVQAVGTPDFDMPGLTSFLLREHCDWVYGRLERDDDTLCVSHSLDVDQLPVSLTRVVEAVHVFAVRTELLLTRLGALSLEDESHDEA